MKDSRKTEKPLAKCSHLLLARYKRKSFLHRIVTGDEKWIYFENPKCKRSWVTPGESSTSTARSNAMDGRQCSVWWDQKGVIYYELLKPGETVNTERYRQQMINLNQALCEKRPEYQKRQHKVILLHDNAPSHTAKLVRKRLRHLVGKYFRMRFTHQTWLRPIYLPLICIDGTRTCSAALHFLRRCTKMAGLVQKSNNFFGVASTHCQSSGKNV